MKKANYSYIGISAIILLFGIWAVPKIVQHFSAPDLAYIIKDGEQAKVAPFSFTNQEGETITNKDYADKVYVVEFFFTTCPDICPIMNENMVKVQNEFYGNPNVGIASFTIDPTFDTVEVLKDYAKAYEITNPNWNLLTGEKRDIYELANNCFNLYVGEVPGGDQSEGTFEHSGYFALVDQEGFIRSRIDDNGNPIIYYDGLTNEGIQKLNEDIKKLL